MLLDKFNELNVLQKTALVWQLGVPISEIHDKLYSYCLFQVFDFYAEMKFSKTNYVFYGLSCFTAQSWHLDLYIKDINVSACYT